MAALCRAIPCGGCAPKCKRKPVRCVPTKADVAAVLDDMVHRFDDALANVAADADVAALTDARRRYAISKGAGTAWWLRHPMDNFAPRRSKSIMAQRSGGKQRRMARGEAGELGEQYARIGQKELLQGTAFFRHGGTQLVYSGLAPGQAQAQRSQNRCRPPPSTRARRSTTRRSPSRWKRLVDAQRRRDAPTPEGRPPDRRSAAALKMCRSGLEPGGEVPLGDLTPSGEPRGAAPALPVAWTQPARCRHTGEKRSSTGARRHARTRAGQDSCGAGPTGSARYPGRRCACESAATEPANAAMVTRAPSRRAGGRHWPPLSARPPQRRRAGSVGEATGSRREEASSRRRACPIEKPIPVGEATEITPENCQAPRGEGAPRGGQDPPGHRQARGRGEEAGCSRTSSARPPRRGDRPEVRPPSSNAPDAIAPAKKQRRPMALPASPWAPVVYGKKPVKKVYRKTVTPAPKSRKVAKKR